MKLNRFAAAVFLLAAAVFSTMPAQSKANVPLTVNNYGLTRVWLTLYEDSSPRSIAGAKWVASRGSVTFPRYPHQGYYLRAEVGKAGDNSAHPHIVCDTTAAIDHSKITATVHSSSGSCNITTT
jgi:hypothetical protein